MSKRQDCEVETVDRHLTDFNLTLLRLYREVAKGDPNIEDVARAVLDRDQVRRSLASAVEELSLRRVARLLAYMGYRLRITVEKMEGGNAGADSADISGGGAG